MANRVIRDGLLDSEVVAALHDRTFRLYVSLLLSADDFGLVEIGFGPISRANAQLAWSRAMVDKMLAELTDAALIFPYEAGGKRFAAIARWKSHINSNGPKWPIPSFGLGHVMTPYGYKNETTRLKVAPFLKHLAENSAPPVPHQRPAGAPLVTEEGRGKREGVRDNPPVFDTPRMSAQTATADLLPATATTTPPATPARTHVPPCPTRQILDLYHAKLPMCPQVLKRTDSRDRAIATRWRELFADGVASTAAEGLAVMAEFFETVANSKFLTGRVPGTNGRPPMLATIDFLMRPTEFAKIVEGFYNREGSR